MEDLRELILAMVTASLICGIVNSVLKDNIIKSGIHFLCGIFLVYTLLAYGKRVEIQFAEYSFRQILADARYEANLGAGKRDTELAEVIRTECEAYILDKAEELGIAVTPEVTVSQEELPLPVRVILLGTATPEQKEILSRMITKDLGIAKEDQHWSG